MDTNNFKRILINKNRGWRGLAEAVVYDDTTRPMIPKLKMIFSFSQAVWDDLIIHNKIVMQDEENYYVIVFDKWIIGKLPSENQQRSVLIKNFAGEIISVNKIKKDEWDSAPAESWSAIRHFIKNKNNHTTSDWNCIGIRVIPEI